MELTFKSKNNIFIKYQLGEGIVGGIRMTCKHIYVYG